MSDLNLSDLPDLPQRPLLTELARDLWADPSVVALWLGGSLARGAGDAHSDVDLRVALAGSDQVPETLPPCASRLTAQAAYHLTRRIAEDAVLHHILLHDGQIYDLWVQTAARQTGEEARLVLGCRDSVLQENLGSGEDPSVRFKPADPEEMRELLNGFWLNQRKHRKVLARGLTLIAWEGEHRLRQEIARLWYALATGQDCGLMQSMTIHSLTPMVQAVQASCEGEALRRLGRSSETEAEFWEAAARMREEVSSVGRKLAERLKFEYPLATEKAAWS